ncbi:hypothetical protein [Fictibacillus gelatini]|uniref:hypothetical protein n=1 Tax=Fictibacillus gelatini TaxID=225985 RepID=UPI000426AA62|nr:hypothetical protein [Fictibacillus gelatini]
MYPQFQYFLEAYCLPGLEEDEFWAAIEEFAKNENQEVRQSLLTEVQTILKNGDLTVAKKMIQEHGNRQFSANETITWLHHIEKKLT